MTDSMGEPKCSVNFISINLKSIEFLYKKSNLTTNLNTSAQRVPGVSGAPLLSQPTPSLLWYGAFQCLSLLFPASFITGLPEVYLPLPTDR